MNSTLGVHAGRRRWFGRAAAPVFAPAFLLALGLVALPPLADDGRAWARSAPESFADLAEKLLPAVVNISTTTVSKDQPAQQQPAPRGGERGGQRRGPEMPQFPPGSPFEEFFKDFFDRQQRPDGPPRRATSLGSGFIIDATGFIVTNSHVIQDADEITVRLHDDADFKAKVVGRDAKTDLALLKIEPGSRKLAAVSFGDSTKARVGDWVLAIGNPFGLGGSVTAGILSARARDINQGPYDDFLQTDASINRGNSGGPLFNMDGQVIGINTAIISPSGGSIGIGFAVPSSLAKTYIQQLRDYGRTRRGWLGVRIQGVTDEIADNLGLTPTRGALVASVTEGGPAEKARIKAGDVIVSFDGRPIPDMRRLPRIVAETSIEKDVEVKVWRDGKEVALRARVGELDESETPTLASVPRDGGKGNERQGKVDALGVQLSQLTPELRQRFDISDTADGVLVLEVDPSGPAAEKGVRPGDVVVEVGQEEVKTPSDLVAKLKKAQTAGRKSVLLLIDRQGEMRFVALRIGPG